jgi:hypothetical protein
MDHLEKPREFEMKRICFTRTRNISRKGAKPAKFGDRK